MGDAHETTSESSGPRTEREVKLLPAPDVDLADLRACIPGSTVHVLPALDLAATYFDAHTLALARAGITLRHRRGEGPDRWTLKLPAGTGPEAMVRREIDVEGPRTHRPPVMAATVAAHLRGRRLVPVAEIRTVRRRVRIDGADGTALVEVALDAVTAVQGRHVLGAWDEIEVEALDGPGALGAQGRVVRALLEAGCTRAPSVPKLVRALGAAAAAPPDVPVARLGPHPSVAAVVQHALTRSVAQILEHDPGVRIGGDPEDLHQFRVAIRRLRSDLRTFSRLIDPERGPRLRTELRWIAGLTGEARDLDVLRAWLLATAGSLPDQDRGQVAALVARCDARRAEVGALLDEAMASARYLSLVHDLVALVTHPAEVHRKDEARTRKHLDRQVRRRWDALDAKVTSMGADPSDADLHQARIAAKRCRAAVEAIRPLAGRDARRLAKALAKLQDVLGAVHDAAVMDAWLRAAADETTGFVAGELAVLAREHGRHHAQQWPDVWAKAQRRHEQL